MKFNLLIHHTFQLELYYYIHADIWKIHYFRRTVPFKHKIALILTVPSVKVLYKYIKQLDPEYRGKQIISNLVMSSRINPVFKTA